MFGEKFTRLLGRGLAIWILILVVESIHGTFRRLLLEPITGDLRARQISVFTGSILICVITFIFVRWLKASTALDLILIGIMWATLTVLFEICLGRFVMGLSWDAIMADFDIGRGGFMIFGLFVMIMAPLAAGKMLAEV